MRQIRRRQQQQQQQQPIVSVSYFDRNFLLFPFFPLFFFPLLVTICMRHANTTTNFSFLSYEKGKNRWQSRFFAKFSSRSILFFLFLPFFSFYFSFFSLDSAESRLAITTTIVNITRRLLFDFSSRVREN